MAKSPVKIDKANPQLPWNKLVDPETLKPVSMAFKALSSGTATEDQQKLTLDFLIKIGCRTYDSDWFPDRDTTSFAAGRRYVGMQIVDMINLKVGKINT